MQYPKSWALVFAALSLIAVSPFTGNGMLYEVYGEWSRGMRIPNAGRNRVLSALTSCGRKSFTGNGMLYEVTVNEVDECVFPMLGRIEFCARSRPIAVNRLR